jgi:CrcB protein
MDRWLVVMLGGALGSLARYLVVREMADRVPMQFPIGTFAVNIVGSFLIGLLMTLLSAKHPNWRLFLVVGGLGGFTTFSSFEWEAYSTVQHGHASLALLYVVSSVIAGYGAVWIGTACAKFVP